jgi:DNA-binding CsgD family transcriptional regulator
VLVEAGARLGFRHGLIRQALYEGMPAGLRAALHLQAARMLAGAGAAAERVAAQLIPAEFDPDPAQLSGQETGALAGMPADDWVVAWLAVAAPVLIYRAPQVAVELLRAVLGQLPGDARRAGLEANLVAALFRLARYEEAERAGVRLLASDTDPQRTAETAWLVAYATIRTGRLAEAISQLTQRLARPGLAVGHTARLRALLAMALVSAGEVDRAEVEARRALAEAEQAGDRIAAGYALHALGSVSSARWQTGVRLEYIDRALSLTEMDPQATDLRLLLLTNKASYLANQDRQADAIATARQALALAEQAGTPRVLAVRSTLGDLHFESGEWDDALAELEQAPVGIGPVNMRLWIHATIALIAAHRADWETAIGHLRAVDDENLTASLPQRDLAWLWLARSLVAEHDGRLAEAAAELAVCLEPSIAERIHGIGDLTASLARLALAGGDRETAVAAARVAGVDAERDPEPVKTAMADHCRGLATGDPEPVLSAAEYFRRTGRPWYRAEALENAAVLEAERGELPAAEGHLTEAVGIYTTLGAAWDIERASARLQPHGLRAARGAFRARPASGWEALTPTEVKVAYLVADGRSNPDVAAVLVLSRNTVQTHVSHILAKLGARSRAEIIREAVRHPAVRSAAAV